MDLDTAVREIHSIPRFPEKPGLKRIQSLLRRMGNPQNQLWFIHVAGTNGKGSTTAMLAEIFQRAGYRTGRFVSPFILEFRERIQVNGEMIPPQELCTLWEQVKTHSRAMEREEGFAPSEFEVVTAIAMAYFARSQCQMVVLEVGLGGRFDATNVISCPEAAVLTNLGLDHTQYLGETIQEIAMEKCGILKHGGAAVVSPGQDPQALEVICRRAREEGVSLHPARLEDLQVQECSLAGSRVVWKGLSLDLPLVGTFQLRNLAAVLQTVCLLRERGWLLSDEAVVRGVANTRFPARMERFAQQPLVLLDGAHNPHGARALGETLDTLAKGRPVTLLMGMMRDKAVGEVLACLLPRAQGLVTAPVSIPRALSPRELALEAEKCGGKLPIRQGNTLEEALALALEMTQPQGVLLICGSLYLAGEIRPLLQGRWGSTSI